MVLNPKRLSVAQLTAFLYAQDELRVRYRPVPIILFSNTMTREQNREFPLPEYPVLVIDLHKRLDPTQSAIRLLRSHRYHAGRIERLCAIICSTMHGI